MKRFFILATTAVIFSGCGGGSQDIGTSATKAAPELAAVTEQSNFEASVLPTAQRRTFVNQPEAGYYSTGIGFNVPNNGKLRKVIVSAQGFAPITLVPAPTLSFMVIEIDGVPTSTNSVRLNSSFIDSATKGSPVTSEQGVPYFLPLMTDQQIAALPAQTTWRFDFYTTDNPSDAPAASETHSTAARPWTIEELKTKAFPELDPNLVADLRYLSAATGVIPIPPGTAALNIRWLVPEGSVAPATAQTYGRAPVPASSPSGATGPIFNDSVSVAAAQRDARIICAPQTATDTHCVSNNGIMTYAGGSTITTVQLVGRDPQDNRSITHNYSTYKINIR